MKLVHPNEALFKGEKPFPVIPSCEHFAGSEKLIVKALELQDKLGYMEPPEWHYPVREALGGALLRQGKAAEARTAYQAAYKALDDKVDYRRLVEAKLSALAAPPVPAAAASGAAK